MGFFDFLKRPTLEQLEEKKLIIQEKLNDAKLRLEKEEKNASFDSFTIDRLKREIFVWETQLKKVEDQIKNNQLKMP